MLLKYIAAFYVTPPGVESKIAVKSLALTDKLKVTVSNTGTKHQLLQNAVLTLKNEKKSIKLTGEELKGLIGENVLGGAKRVFKITKSQNAEADMKGSLKFD